MRLSQMLTYFETSAAISLFRARNAPFIIDFIGQQFKQAGRIVIPQAELLAALRGYIEEIQEQYLGVLSDKADTYLNDWCSSDTRWLQRVFEANLDEPVYKLSTEFEDAFGFLLQALNRDLGFVGTESRLKLIVETLSDLVGGSSDDPQIRIQHLQEEQARLQAEIEQIEKTGKFSKYHPAIIRERFATAVTLLRQLQGDFRAVEESFRDITTQVQQKQVAGQDNRGQILEFALDSEDLLKREDQGVSFYEFVRLILSPSKTDRLEKIIREVRQIPELTSQQEGLDTVRSMVTLLQNEAEKVMRTNQRLSATLRRLLDTRAHAERQRLARLLQEIQGLACELSAESDDEEFGLSLELDLAIESPFRRTFWTEPARLEAVNPEQFEPDSAERLAAFHSLAMFQRLNWNEMREHVAHMLAIEGSPTLGALLKVHPAEAGVIEVIGYLEIAIQDGHRIDSEITEEVVVSSDYPSRNPVILKIPRVTFAPHRKNGHAK